MPQARPIPGWVIVDNCWDEELGALRAGKEAGCFLIKRTAGDRFCLLVRKDYRKRSDRTYNNPVRAGERRIRRDDYMASVAIRLPSERKAVRAGNAFGREVMEAAWAHREFVVLQQLWQAGASVPYPVERTEHGFTMQYVGTSAASAPRLADLRLERSEATAMFDRLVEQLHVFVGAGIAHGDLSAYNILVQHGRPWIIDVPQATELDSVHGRRFFERDVTNICRHFERLGVVHDAGVLTAELLG